MTDIFKQAKKYAKQLGFDNVWSNEYGTFVAEYSHGRVDVRRDVRYGSQITIEIGWSSAGSPRPTDAQVKKFIQMLQNALKLKAHLKKIK